LDTCNVASWDYLSQLLQDYPTHETLGALCGRVGTPVTIEQGQSNSEDRKGEKMT
jgi:hypothetical protein